MIKILYIDDEAHTDKMKSRFDIFTDEGIETIPIVDLKDMKATYERFKNELDCIVLDLIMPPYDHYKLEDTDNGTTTGIAVLKVLRELDQTIPIAIVSINAYKISNDEFLNKYNVCLSAQKPIPAADLAAEIKKAISNCKKVHL